MKSAALVLLAKLCERVNGIARPAAPDLDVRHIEMMD